MITRFNKAQLERNRLDSLERVVAVLQSENEAEIEVGALEFPEKLSVKLDKSTMVLTWDAEKKSYSGQAEPELSPESLRETAGFAADLDMAGKIIPNGGEVDPVQMAERTFVLVKENMRMSPKQRQKFHKAYADLWMKEC